MSSTGISYKWTFFLDHNQLYDPRSSMLVRIGSMLMPYAAWMTQYGLYNLLLDS
jgi:hypothetical protein